VLKSAIPAKFPITFASSAGGSFIRTVPQTPTGTPGQASLQTGFPPENFSPVSTGGVPPFGQDFNGILQQITAWNQWQAASGIVPYDSTFQTAIGGYPQNAIVQSATTLGIIYLCTVDNNLTNPDSAGAGWVSFNMLGGVTIPAPTITTFTTPGAYSFTVPANIYRVRVQLWGGGGGGGFGAAGSPGGAATGGGGGGYTNKVLSVNPGDSITGSVGAAGAAGTGGGNGGNGGSTTAIYSAVTYTGGGGNGGTNATAGTASNSVSGGTTTNGDVTSHIGQPSYGGILGYSGSIILPYGGAGGVSVYGGFGGQAGTGAANPGGTPGGGGGGSATAGTAGAGARGEAWISY
jgi:hypothetical protein